MVNLASPPNLYTVILHLEPVLLAHVLDGQPAHPPDPLHVLLLLPDVQPLLQPFQVNALRELLA